MRVTKVITVMFVLAWLTASARPFQQKTYPPNADGFNALLLNETTVDDALNILGPPDADEIGTLDVSKIGKWLDPKHKEKSFRQLRYKKSPDFFKIELSFLDQRLVMIDLEYKKNVRPQTMSKLFDVDFTELGGPIDLPDKPGQQPRGGFITTHWPNFYSMVGISAKTFIFVNCASSGGGESPGRVERTRQISRILEKH
ncbi:MAG TPA: hypothetical protein VJV21_09360 [Pyrinomonadaceae bacterium]|nr:hypothetical protein [Pyrinomonadaceae bacterium]